MKSFNVQLRAKIWFLFWAPDVGGPGSANTIVHTKHKWKNDKKVRRGVRREHKMGTNCVAGSAEGTKWGQIVLSEDPNLKYIIPIFGHNLVNEDRHKSILCSRRTRRKSNTKHIRLMRKHFVSSEDQTQST